MTLGLAAALFLRLAQRGGKRLTQRQRLQQYESKLAKCDRVTIVDVPYRKILCLLGLLVVQVLLCTITNQHQLSSSDQGMHNGTIKPETIITDSKPNSLPLAQAVPNIGAVAILLLAQLVLLLRLQVRIFHGKASNNFMELHVFTAISYQSVKVKAEDIVSIAIKEVGAQRLSQSNIQQRLEVQAGTKHLIYTSQFRRLLQRRYIELHAFLRRPIDYDKLCQAPTPKSAS